MCTRWCDRADGVSYVSTAHPPSLPPYPLHTHTYHSAIPLNLEHGSTLDNAAPLGSFKVKTFNKISQKG